MAADLVTTAIKAELPPIAGHCFTCAAPVVGQLTWLAAAKDTRRAWHKAGYRKLHGRGRCNRCYLRALKGGEIDTATTGTTSYRPFVAPPPWTVEAVCAEVDPDTWFPEKGGSTREAKQVCVGCPVRVACLEFAIEHGERFGVWGGKSERERRKIATARALGVEVAV